MLKKVLVFSLVMLMVITASTFAQLVQNVGTNGQLDWSEQLVRSTGIGSPNPNMPATAQRAGALEAAKRIALRNLLETVQGMSIDAETTVENYMVTNDVITNKVRGVVRGFTVVDTKYMSDGSVEVTIEVPMSGVLTETLLPQAYTNTPASYGTQMGNQAAMGGGGAKTGLVIDAKGLGVRPAMAPKILDENGQEVYGSKYVSRDWAVQIGVVGYDKDVAKARTNDRVTANPLVVKGLKVSGANKSDIVVSNASAQMIRDAAASQNFLDKCKVMFIVD